MNLGVGLALGAAMGNPALGLALGTAMSSSPSPSTSRSRLTTHRVSDEEALRQVERALAARAEKQARIDAFNEWLAIPGNDVILRRQRQTLRRLDNEENARTLAKYEADVAAEEAVVAADKAQASRRSRRARLLWSIGLLLPAITASVLGAWPIVTAVIYGIAILIMLGCTRRARFQDYDLDSNSAMTLSRSRMWLLRQSNMASNVKMWGPGYMFDFLDPLDESQD
ncbi:hypothetical protein KIKIMORA_01140 [Brevundimonas phage vB_BpoS-Kikimora]|uniref:Uncharacterized protein n=1 Tax=Brevundimonas phage vB_BpoS-Kikimora TaxID=2948601 RepID=A0A9E7MSG9_9CAUD|nr:hypothetical protein KIKIMORA_01140 [Brevundimonas phage vB_BpoS-Kikimora]